LAPRLAVIGNCFKNISSIKKFLIGIYKIVVEVKEVLVIF